MSVAAKQAKIDQLMEKASVSLSRTAYFEAERMALKALMMARQIEDFERMARIALPLQEVRRQRLQIALDNKDVCVLDQPYIEGMKLKAGCYLIQPPQVGADGRRLRLAALQSEIPVAVITREPLTQTREWPIVAVGPGLTVRTRVEPPDDPDAPDMAWFVGAMETMGDAAIDLIDPSTDAVKRIDHLLEWLDAIPEHEKLHQALAETCREVVADRSAASTAAAGGRSGSKTR